MPLNFTEEIVLNYYNTLYANDLKGYFNITHRDGLNQILSLGHDHNPHRLSSREEYCRRSFERFNRMLFNHTEADSNLIEREENLCTEYEHIFSGIFAHNILIQQALAEFCGEELWINEPFHRSSGWPMISAGLAGTYCDVLTMLGNARLLPYRNEVERYKTMMEVLHPIMIAEIRDFLTGKNPTNINPSAYKELIESTNPKIEIVIGKIEDKYKYMIENLRTQEEFR